jgi:transcriptional regulator with XRE-family HTH domain
VDVWDSVSKKVLDRNLCVLYTTQYMSAFGKYIRKKRESLRQTDKSFSLRQVAGRIGVEPSYLSKIERGDHKTYLIEGKIRALANDLNEDPDVLLALSGKISQDIQEIIRKRPQIFAQLIRELKKMPDNAVLRIVREVRDGNW